MKKSMVDEALIETKKVFVGNWKLFIILLFLGIIPALIYFFAKRETIIVHNSLTLPEAKFFSSSPDFRG